jgi:hypothetical protein
MDELSVGLSSWIIQDGNYGDFEEGGQYTFALEFALSSIESIAPEGRSLRHIAGSDYRFTAEVVFTQPGVVVIDAGVLCYREDKSTEGLVTGSFIAGDLSLGIDPFFWLETHSRAPGAPNLFYRWRLRAILLETTPWVDTGGSFQRAQVPRTFKAVPRTDAWAHDGGHAEYVLVCELLGLVNKNIMSVTRQ